MRPAFIFVLFWLGSHTYALEPIDICLDTDVHRNIVISWNIKALHNHIGFEVQHSLNGEHFEAIGRVKEKTISGRKQPYRFVHENPSSGRHFYRLRTIKTSGKSLVSGIYTLDIVETREILISGNPIKGDVVKLLITGNFTYIDFLLIDDKEKIIFTERVIKRKKHILIDMYEVPAGRYRFRLMTPSGKINEGTIELQL